MSTPRPRPSASPTHWSATSALLLAACALGLASPVARADVVVLKSGKRIEGQTRRTDAGVEIKGRFGSTLIPWKQVHSVEDRPTAQEAFDARRRALAPGDVPGAAALGTFALDNNLAHEARKLLKPLADLQPKHPALDPPMRRMQFHFNGKAWIPPEVHYKALGWTRLRGKWRSPEEIERIRASQALGDLRTALAQAKRNEKVAIAEEARAERRVPEAKRELAAAEAALTTITARIRVAEATLNTRQADLNTSEFALTQARADRNAWAGFGWACPLRACGARSSAGVVCVRQNLCAACVRRCSPRSHCGGCRAHFFTGNRLAQAALDREREVVLRRAQRDAALKALESLRREVSDAPLRVARAKTAVAAATEALPVAQRAKLRAQNAHQAALAALAAGEARLKVAKQEAKGAPKPVR